MARATNPISGQQASTWGPVFANNNAAKGVACMRNLPSRKPQQVQKRVKLLFDPESTSEFPHLQTDKDRQKDYEIRHLQGKVQYVISQFGQWSDQGRLPNSWQRITCSCSQQSPLHLHCQHRPHHDHFKRKKK